MILIRETLERYAKEGRNLYDALFFQSIHIYNTKDAKNFLERHARYEFIAQLFQDMQMYGWRNETKFNEDLDKDGIL